MSDAERILQRLESIETALLEQKHATDLVNKRVDDVLWAHTMADIATIEKIRYVGPPRYEENPTAQAAGNQLVVHGYVFLPKILDTSRKYPMLVMVHGGVHGNVRCDHYRSVVRELMEKGYVVFAPEYRGSAGYGRAFHDQIDYGGKEVEDVHCGALWMLERYSFLDENRVGILGWSHGGFISLWNVFKYPETYHVAFAGAPVSNLALRAGTKARDVQGYPADVYGAPSGIGKCAFDDVNEYIKRSPVYNTSMLCRPLLIHAASNDSDVNLFEVQQLIESLTFQGKEFEYKVFQDAPGEHHFELIDTTVGRNARQELYRFLDLHLHPDIA